MRKFQLMGRSPKTMSKKQPGHAATDDVPLAIRFEVKFACARVLIGGEHLQKARHHLLRLIERRPPDVYFICRQFIVAANAMPYRLSAHHSRLVQIPAGSYTSWINGRSS